MWGTYYGYTQIEIMKKKALSSSNSSFSTSSSTSK